MNAKEIRTRFLRSGSLNMWFINMISKVHLKKYLCYLNLHLSIYHYWFICVILSIIGIRTVIFILVKNKFKTACIYYFDLWSTSIICILLSDVCEYYWNESVIWKYLFRKTNMFTFVKNHAHKNTRCMFTYVCFS